MITWELKQAILLRQSVTQTRSGNNGEASPCFYVAVSNLPPHLQSDQELRGLCAHWDHQIALISMLGAQHKTNALEERLEGLVRHIERRETAFIHQIVRLQKRGISNEQLADCLEQRHLGKSHGGWLHGWLRDTLSQRIPYCAQPIDWLYFTLLKLVRSRQDLVAIIGQERKSAAVIGLRDHRDARSLARHLPSGDAASIRAQYLGPNLDQIIPSFIPQSRITEQARSGFVNILTAVLIVLWTIPVGANGFASQISSAFRLLHRNEDWHIPAWLTGLVQGVLPQLTAYLVMNLMLIILRFLMNNKGHLTSTDVQLSIQQFYFWFLFTQLFITTSISSGLIPTLVKIIDGGAAQLPQILARNLPLASNYYLSYLVLHIGTQSLSMLARIPAIIKLYASVGRCRTPKDQIDALYGLHQVVRWGEIYPVYTTIGVIGKSPEEPAFPPSLTPASYFPNNLVIIYSLLMPLILPIAALTCAMLRFCFRYAFLYTAYITVDTSGRLYFRAILNLYWGIITMELALLGLFLLKVDPNSLRNDLGQISVLLLTILGTIQYQRSIQRFYQPLIRDYEAVSRQGTTTEIHPQPDVSEKYRPAVSKVQDSRSLAAVDLNIWLPKDVGGVSDGLIESVRTNYIGPSAQIRLTNSGAAMDSDGHVVLDDSTEHNILSAPKVR
jgi:hypothetical protein